MITWLDYISSPRRLSICLSQREQQNIAAQSVTPKYHHWASCFYFLFKCWKVLNLLCFISTQIDNLNGLQTIVKLWTYDLAIWQPGNLAIWQSGNLAAIWKQSGSNLAIWEWQSCITASSTSMAIVMAMAMAMAMCHRDCCWNSISKQARRTQWQRTQPFARLRGSRFSKHKISKTGSHPSWSRILRTVTFQNSTSV